MYQAKISRLCHLKTPPTIFLKIAWCMTVDMYWGPMGSNMLWKFFCSCYAVAKYILEASIEAKSGWPLPKPNTNYPILSTVLEGYNYIPWPPYKPPSTEQWTHCEVLISGIKSLNITLDAVLDYSYVLCTRTPKWVSGGSPHTTYIILLITS